MSSKIKKKRKKRRIKKEKKEKKEKKDYLLTSFTFLLFFQCFYVVAIVLTLWLRTIMMYLL